MKFLRRLFGREAPPAEEQSPQDRALPESPPVIEAPPVEEIATAEILGEEDFDKAVVEVEEAAPQALIQTAPLEDAADKIPETAPLIGDRLLLGATRQLPAMEEIAMVSNSALNFGHRIDVGRVRNNNQDAVVACAMVVRDANSHADFGLFAVADGMGGHLDGEKASAQVASTVTEQIISRIYLPLLQQDLERAGQDEDTSKHIPVNEVLAQALQAANLTIISKIPNSGTTATLVVLIGNSVHLAHIGDSRAYIINESGIEQITRDHSLAQRLFEVGKLTREEMGSFTRRNELYKVLGFTEDVEPDVSSRRLSPGSYLLLCSDGLWGEVPDALIQDVVLASASPQAACDRLVELANERGGHDNVSVVIVQVPYVV